jgi:hypothetical protein
MGIARAAAIVADQPPAGRKDPPLATDNRQDHALRSWPDAALSDSALGWSA